LDVFGPTFIFRLITVVVSLVIHEFAHAFVASLLGDKTAKRMGRVTLNPVAHLDPIGLLMIVFAPIGWAKPVPVNIGNFKHPRLGSILVSLAGPIANLVLAMVCLIALNPSFTEPSFIAQLLYVGFYVNVALFVFNLIPIPPLDGSRVVSSFIPYRYEVQYRKLELYGPFILLLIVIIPGLNRAIFSPLFNGTANTILTWFGYS
jgi:Zn-dependent protease